MLVSCSLNSLADHLGKLTAHEAQCSDFRWDDRQVGADVKVSEASCTL